MLFLFGDTQLQADRPVSMDDWDTDKKLGDKVSQMCKTGAWIAELISEYKPDNIVFLGDVNERQGNLSLFTIYMIHQLSKLWFPEGTNCYSVLGNHDIYNPSGTINTHVLFPDNVESILPNMPINVDNYLLASYSVSTEDYMKSLKGSEWDTLITHMSIKGMEFNSGFVDTDGIDMSDSMFDGKKAFVGHYHRPEILEMGKCDLTVVGSPMYHNWGDEWDSHRGVTIVLDSGEVINEINPYTKRYIKVDGSKAQDTLQDAVKQYGADNLNVKIVNGSNIRDSFDMDEFSSYKLVEQCAGEKEDRVNGISINSNYDDDVCSYIGVSDTELDKDKLKGIAKEAIDMVMLRGASS